MKNRSTGYNANMMMLLMEVTQPVDILMGTEGAEMRDENPSAYLTRLHKTLQEVHQLAREHLQSSLCYQKRAYDLKLQQNHYEVGDLVYRLNQKGECRKLKPIWVGPLIVTEVITPVLLWVRSRKKEQVLHHDKLKICEDRAIPMWMRRLQHQILDLDTTIAYDEAEQEEDGSAQNVPKVDGNTDSLGLDSLFEVAGNGDAMAEQAVESTTTEAAGEVGETKQGGELAVSQNPSVDEESAGENILGSLHVSVDEESADGRGNIQKNSTVDEQSTGKEKGSSLSDDEKSSDSESGSNESQVKMTRRGRAVKPPSHLRDYKL